jgi:rfaE bifunctional protein nucleotidyltransferase chain/domain
MRVPWTDFLEQVEGQCILVFGELSLVQTVYGQLTIDTDNPLCMHLQVNRRSAAPGGAAAIARGLAAVGAHASLCGLIGDDLAGQTVLKLLAVEPVDTRAVVIDPQHETSVMTQTVALTSPAECHPVVEEWLQDPAPIHPTVREELRRAAVETLEQTRWLVISNHVESLEPLIGYLYGAAKGLGIDVIVAPRHAHLPPSSRAATPSDKLATLKQVQWLAVQQRDRGRRMVFTNGCFDLLHAGHAKYLQAAAELGDYLVVALNDDASVHALKGSGRPVVDERRRAALLGALACVDAVILFSDEDVRPLLDVLQPEVYVKGGDYTLDTINQQERHLIESYGGQIALLPGEDGLSTTDLIRAIRALP